MLVLWDLENQGHLDPLRMRNQLMAEVEERQHEYRAYSCAAKVSRETRDRLARSGWSLVDCPHKEGKQSVDTRIVFDALTRMRDVVLVSGDGDFAPLLFALRERGCVAWLAVDEQRAAIVHRDLLEACTRVVVLATHRLRDDGIDGGSDEPSAALLSALQTASPGEEGWCNVARWGPSSTSWHPWPPIRPSASATGARACSAPSNRARWSCGARRADSASSGRGGGSGRPTTVCREV